MSQATERHNRKTFQIQNVPSLKRPNHKSLNSKMSLISCMETIFHNEKMSILYKNYSCFLILFLWICISAECCQRHESLSINCQQMCDEAMWRTALAGHFDRFRFTQRYVAFVPSKFCWWIWQIMLLSRNNTAPFWLSTQRASTRVSPGIDHA